MMDEPTLGDALRARPSGDPTYRSRLDPGRPGGLLADPSGGPPSRATKRRPTRLVRLVTIGTVAVLAAGVILVVGSMPQRPSDPDPDPIDVPRAFTNGRIAFDREGDLWIAEADGSGARPILTGPAIDRAPSWSPDGQWIAYWRGEGDDLELRAVRPDGTDDQLVASGPLDPFLIAWQAEARHTALLTLLQPAQELSTLIVEQTIGRPTRSPLVPGGVAPAVAPDGRVAYLTHRTEGVLSIWDPLGRTVMQPLPEEVMGGPSELGSPPYRVERPVRVDPPSWDPSGRYLVLAQGTATDRDIVLVDAAGGGGPRWSTPWDEWSPVWSPGGEEIAWLRRQDGRTVIQVAATDGSSQRSPITVADDASAIVGAPDGTGWLVVHREGFDLWMERPDGRDGPEVSVAAPGTSGIVSWEAIPR